MVRKTKTGGGWACAKTLAVALRRRTEQALRICHNASKKLRQKTKTDNKQKKKERNHYSIEKRKKGEEKKSLFPVENKSFETS